MLVFGRNVFDAFFHPVMLTQKQPALVPTLGFAARSGTGKTTLLKQLIPYFKADGLSVALIKHSHHRVTFDNAGLTRALFERGIDVYADSETLSVYECQRESETVLSDTRRYASQLPIDLLLVEGFKHQAFPKIELHRQSLNQALLCENDDNISAVASDTPNETREKLLEIGHNLPVLDLNHKREIYKWILQTYLPQHPLSQ